MFKWFFSIFIVGCSPSFKTAAPTGGPNSVMMFESPPFKTYNPESYFRDNCDSSFSWNDAKGNSSSLQILQKPSVGFQYESEYKSLYSELTGTDLKTDIDELTQPIVVISKMTLFEQPAPQKSAPINSVELKFGVKIADLVSDFGGVALGIIPYDTVQFDVRYDTTKHHVCGDSIAIEFQEKSNKKARLIMISEKSNADQGVLVRLWLKATADSSTWKGIGYTWIDKAMLFGKPKNELEQTIREPASISNQNLEIEYIISCFVFIALFASLFFRKTILKKWKIYFYRN